MMACARPLWDWTHWVSLPHRTTVTRRWGGSYCLERGQWLSCLTESRLVHWGRRRKRDCSQVRLDLPNQGMWACKWQLRMEVVIPRRIVAWTVVRYATVAVHKMQCLHAVTRTDSILYLRVQRARGRQTATLRTAEKQVRANS